MVEYTQTGQVLVLTPVEVVILRDILSAQASMAVEDDEHYEVQRFRKQLSAVLDKFNQQD